jgi:outer membrane cobalamin receptor
MTVLSTTALSAHADPQQVPQPASGQQRSDNDELDEIVVTGSRIARPDDERLQPTTIIAKTTTLAFESVKILWAPSYAMSAFYTNVPTGLTGVIRKGD